MGGLLIGTTVILCPILQGMAMYKLKNRWLIAAKLSLFALITVYLFTLFLIIKGHALWPAAILLSSPVFATYLALLFLLNWIKDKNDETKIIYSMISVLLGLMLISPFVWGMANDYAHGRDNSVGGIFVPLVLFGLFLQALIGAQLFVSGMICLKPKQRLVTVLGLLICTAMAGTMTFVFWSQGNIDHVVESAERIAGEMPYCIDVASGNSYKEATSLSDFSGYNMRAPHDWGLYAGPHAILAVESGTQSTFYHWSYDNKSFVADRGRLTVSCSPRKHFALTFSGGERDEK